MHFPQLVVLAVKILDPKPTIFSDFSHSNQQPFSPVILSAKKEFDIDASC